MDRTLYVIDDNGHREVEREGMNFWEKFDYSGSDSDWPAFTQLVARTKPRDLANALRNVARTVGLRCVEAEESERSADFVVCVAQNGETLALAEPDTDLEDRFLQPETAESIMGLLAVDGAFFGHDPAAGTIHVTTFDLGLPSVTWCDSTQPGPSFARTFHRDGTATEEDPRTFALRRMEMPETSPLLDRYAFVHRTLEPFGIEGVWPDLEGLKVVGEYALVSVDDASE